MGQSRGRNFPSLKFRFRGSTATCRQVGRGRCVWDILPLFLRPHISASDACTLRRHLGQCCVVCFFRGSWLALALNLLLAAEQPSLAFLPSATPSLDVFDCVRPPSLLRRDQADGVSSDGRTQGAAHLAMISRPPAAVPSALLPAFAFTVSETSTRVTSEEEDIIGGMLDRAIYHAPMLRRYPTR
jgi:hypothetical protein